MTEANQYHHGRLHGYVTPQGEWRSMSLTPLSLLIRPPDTSFMVRDPLMRFLVVTIDGVASERYHVQCGWTRVLLHAFDDFDAAIACAVTLAN